MRAKKSLFTCVTSSTTCALPFLAVGRALLLTEQSMEAINACLALSTGVHCDTGSGFLVIGDTILVFAVWRRQTVAKEIAPSSLGTIRGAIQITPSTPLCAILTLLSLLGVFQGLVQKKMEAFICLLDPTSKTCTGEEEQDCGRICHG